MSDFRHLRQRIANIRTASESDEWRELADIADAILDEVEHCHVAIELLQEKINATHDN